MQDKDISPHKVKMPYNKDGQSHGVWEWFWTSGKLRYRCNYVKSVRCGYFELYSEEGLILEHEYYAR